MPFMKQSPLHITRALCLSIFLLAASQNVIRAQSEAPDLFEPAADDSHPAAMRLRREVLDRVKPGGSIHLNTLPGPLASAVRAARVTAVTTTNLGGRVIRARLDDDPPGGGSVLFVQHGAATRGIIATSSGERYSLEGDTLTTVPTQTTARCACELDTRRASPLTRRRVAAVSPSPPLLPAADSPPAEFDVLIVYTPAALKALGSVDALTAQAELAMADANACYQNSAIPIVGRIVGVRAVDYAESGEIRTDLHRLAVPDDGILDEVQGYRDEAEADFVCMFTRHDSADGYRGYAEILVVTTPDAEILGFSVVDAVAATGEHLFAHELGHNMGCDHDRENTTNLHLFDFSYGWRFTGQDGKLYRDVMAYAPGASTPYFANPVVSYAGTPTGVADYADTARTLRESAPAFVNFRSSDGLGRVSLRASVPTATVDDKGRHSATFALERTGSVAQPLDVTVQPGGTAVGGVNYQTLPGHASFAAGSHFARLRIKPVADAAPFGVETVALTLQPGAGYVVSDSPTGGGGAAAMVTIYDRLPLVSLGAARRAGVAPGGKLKVRVRRLGRVDGPLVVRYALGGTAVAGVDYRAPNGRPV